ILAAAGLALLLFAPAAGARTSRRQSPAHQEGFRGVDTVRYDDEESACSSPPVFSALIFRRTRVPLCELHFTHGNQFKRLFAFAYVDGAFRLMVLPDFSARGPTKVLLRSTRAAR